MTIDDTTPVLIGAGQFAERVGEEGYEGLANYELAAKAGERALADVGANQPIAGHIDALAAVRTFEDVSPVLGQPFGKSSAFPWSVAKRLDADPDHVVYEDVGGQSPQNLVTEFGGRIAAGEFGVVLLCGAENISTVTHLQRSGGSADWSEAIDRPMESRLSDNKGMINRDMVAHQLIRAPENYALSENARRRRLGMSREDYAQAMGELFAPFTKVAAENPYSAQAIEPMSAEEIAFASEKNRWITTPYPIRLVAKEKVNQGAALLLASVAKARELGVPQEKWVFLHGACGLVEPGLWERADISASPAAQMVASIALERASVGIGDIGHFDFYSCFPIAVANSAIDGLGMAADDPRGLTLTGGLPYFGGAGNNYSMHAIAEMIIRLRGDPGSFGLVSANGGYLTKTSVGVYSTVPREWRDMGSAELQAGIDAAPKPVWTSEAEGDAVLESYTIHHGRDGPTIGVIYGRLGSGEAFLANNADAETLATMVEDDPLGAKITVERGEKANLFRFG
ncbi:MAG: acetyl-CoA acetyltransferase [Sphingomonadaceae bacterium]|nr:acetyl-CoA acetyltransferase [Sphingomonadaceae bacterium]